MKTGNGSQVPAVFFCVGPEKWLRDQAVRRLKSRCVTAGFEEMDYLHFSEPPEEPRTLMEAVQVSPFGSPARLIVIEGLNELSEKALPWLSAYLAHPNPKACLVLCAEKVDRGTDFAAGQRSGLVQLLWCQPLKGKELKDWVIQQAMLAGAPIEQEAAALLLGRVGSELQRLVMALETLALLAGASGCITVANVEALITPSMRETAFDILDAAAAGHPEVAIAQMRQAVAQGQLTVEQFMGALGWYYRMVWKSRRGGSSGSWFSPQRQAAIGRLSRWPEKKLRSAMENVLEADVELKLSVPAPELLADRLLLQLGS